jgi:anti-sigma factor RsiW
MSSSPLTCEEFVELVTDYLEGALDPATEDRFVQHANDCPGCDIYLEQFRETIRLTGRIEPENVDPATLDRLLDAFRDWKAT